MSSPTILPTPLRLALIALALACALWAGVTGIAALSQFRAKSYLEVLIHQSDINPHYNPDTDYHAGLAAAQLSIALAPGNSDNLTGLANLLLWRLSHTPGLSVSERQHLHDAILDHYRRALAQRPSWTHTFARFAVLKAQLGEFDAEMMHAIHTADRLGPYEFEVMHILLELGLANWQRLDQPTQAVIIGVVVRSLSWNLNEMMSGRERMNTLSLIGYYHRQGVICPLLPPETPQVGIMCAPYRHQSKARLNQGT